MGADAKTDQIHAKVISQIASVLKPIASEAQSDEERSHSALVTRRTQLVDLITQERNRHNQKIRAYYAHLNSHKKESKVAIVACMRKFITILNHLIKTDPKHAHDDFLSAGLSLRRLCPHRAFVCFTLRHHWNRFGRNEQMIFRVYA